MPEPKYVRMYVGELPNTVTLSDYTLVISCSPDEMSQALVVLDKMEQMERHGFSITHDDGYTDVYAKVDK